MCREWTGDPGVAYLVDVKHLYLPVGVIRNSDENLKLALKEACWK
jgi:hypothetical protein